MSTPGNGKDAAELIAKVGIYGLGGSDGCACCHFEVMAFGVDISCHKSSGDKTIRVHTHYLGVSPDDLKLVASEVVKQLSSIGYDFKVRFCDYDHDVKSKCIYCGLPRDPVQYLCSKCLSSLEIASSYDYTKIVLPKAEGR